MKLTAQIKLQPSEEQRELLLQTLERANEACDWISGQAWESETVAQYKLHDAVYHDVRERFELASQMTIRAIGKVADTYKTNPDTRNRFSIRGGFPYGSRVLTYYTEREEVSIWTLSGRERIGYVCGERQRRMLESQQGESDLVYHRGKFYLLATCNVEEPDPEDMDDVLGIDLGIENIATDSTGESWSGRQIDEKQEWYAERKRALQSVGTRSSKRRLRQLSGKQSRFQKDVSHCISKRLVAKAKARSSAIALEDLSGIRERTTVSKSQRSRHSNWSFHDLHKKVEYKAALAGVPVHFVDPAYTSQTCSSCGHTSRRNRKSQSEFECRECGMMAHADYNAALNIASKVEEKDVSFSCQPA